MARRKDERGNQRGDRGLSKRTRKQKEKAKNTDNTDKKYEGDKVEQTLLSVEKIQTNLTNNIIFAFKDIQKEQQKLACKKGKGYAHGIFISTEETREIAEAIICQFEAELRGEEDHNTDGDTIERINNEDMDLAQSIACSLAEYLPFQITALMNTVELTLLVRKSIYGQESNDGKIGDDDDSSNISYNSQDKEVSEEGDVDGYNTEGEYEYIAEGECEMCERENMKLTRHHLIPKSTWKRMIQKLMKHHRHSQQQQQMSTGRSGNSIITNHTELQHIIEQIPISDIALESTSNLKLFLSHYCAEVCRPCHSMIHNTFDNNMELAERYYTVELLLEDKRIWNFCKWAHSQKGGKYRR